jgi:hypothetical protein
MISMGNCIEWAAGTTTAGYGVKVIGGKHIYAHRLTYCTHRGLPLSVIEGDEIRHSCDNPRCINPDHLILGTHAQNMRDMVLRNRQPKGEDRANSKLKTADVIAIREAYANGEWWPRKLAKKYDVSRYAIMDVATGKSWGWLK